MDTIHIISCIVPDSDEKESIQSNKIKRGISKVSNSVVGQRPQLRDITRRSVVALVSNCQNCRYRYEGVADHGVADHGVADHGVSNDGEADRLHERLLVTAAKPCSRASLSPAHHELCVTTASLSGLCPLSLHQPLSVHARNLRTKAPHYIFELVHTALSLPLRLGPLLKMLLLLLLLPLALCTVISH